MGLMKEEGKDEQQRQERDALIDDVTQTISPMSEQDKEYMLVATMCTLIEQGLYTMEKLQMFVDRAEQLNKKYGVVQR